MDVLLQLAGLLGVVIGASMLAPGAAVIAIGLVLIYIGLSMERN